LLYKQQTGYSPIAYKNRLAIQNASHALLLENNSVEAVSEEYGFESPIYFRRLFKKILGTTPTAYRKQAKLM
jgi:YesN/AraC family two-component response regulator